MLVKLTPRASYLSRHPARIPRDGLQRLQVLQGAGGEDVVLPHPRRGRQGDSGPGRNDGPNLEGHRDPIGLSKVVDPIEINPGSSHRTN
jgi:hypothetical protein